MGNIAPMASKKWTMGLVGIVGVIISGAAAACAGPVGIAVLPYVVGGIVGIVGGQMYTQGKVDEKVAIAPKNQECPK